MDQGDGMAEVTEECRCQRDSETALIVVICSMHVRKVGREMLAGIRRAAEVTE